MANGSVFQLLPQRFGKDIGVMTGLVGAGGGIGGFYLASSLGYSKGLTGSYLTGLPLFAGALLPRRRWPQPGEDPLAHHVGRPRRARI